MPTHSTQIPQVSITCDDVYTHLTTLDFSKATGSDSISAHLLKLCATAIVPHVTALFNECLTYGCLPEE